MTAYRRVYDSHHLQADCQEPGSAPEPYARQSSMGYLLPLLLRERREEGRERNEREGRGPTSKAMGRGKLLHGAEGGWMDVLGKFSDGTNLCITVEH